MSAPVDFGILAVPARIANLAFRLAVSRDWTLHDLPGEDVDFSSPGAFFPLLLATAPWAAVALTVAARPAFEDGTIQDWALFLLDSQGIRPTSMSPVEIGGLRALFGAGHQQQQDTALEVRFAFLEDGGRLVYLGMMASEALSSSTEVFWTIALANFSIDEPQGQTAEVGPASASYPSASNAPPNRLPNPNQRPSPPPHRAAIPTTKSTTTSAPSTSMLSTTLQRKKSQHPHQLSNPSNLSIPPPNSVTTPEPTVPTRSTKNTPPTSTSAIAGSALFPSSTTQTTSAEQLPLQPVPSAPTSRSPSAGM